MRAERDHAEAIAALMKPAEAFLQKIADERRSRGGDPAHFWRKIGEHKTIITGVAEMLLPLKQQLDRLESRQEGAEHELDRQVDNLRRRIEAAR